MLFLLVVFPMIPLSWAVDCFTCLDPAIINRKHMIKEVNFRQMKKLPICDLDNDPVRKCFVGCYELELLWSGMDPVFLRACATDRIIEQLQPNGTQYLPERVEDDVTVRSYMCTRDKCNTKFGRMALPWMRAHPLLFWLLIIILISATFTCLICVVRTGSNTNNRRLF